MGKTKVTIIFFVMTLVLFSACEKTPERESSSVVITESESKQGLEKYITLKDVRKEVEELKGKKYLDMTLPYNIMITNENQVGNYSVHWVLDDSSTFEAIVEKIWDDYHYIDVESDYCIRLKNSSIEGYDYDVHQYFHKENPDDEYLSAMEREDDDYIIHNSDYLLVFSTWGSFGGSSHNLYEINLEGPGFKKVAEYNLLWGDVYDSTEYEVEDGKMTINEVVELVEKRCNDALKDFDGDVFKHKVAYVSVYKSENTGLHIFDVVSNRFVKDIPVDPCDDFLNMNTINWGKAISGRGMYDYRIIKKGEISSFRESYATSFKIVKSEKVTNIISLKYALSSIKEQIATIGISNIQQCGLVYLFSCDTKLRHDINDYNSFSFLHYDKDIEDSVRMRPYWLFAVKGKKLYHGASILVDAIDGTVYYFDYTY